MLKMPRNLIIGFFAMACALVSYGQAWPTLPIKIVVPFTPGTGMDTIARVVAPRLSERLGQPVVVQNTPGASGNIGADAVAKANPDGNTLLMGANTMLIASQLYKNANFNPINDLSSVSMAAWGTLMLVANPKTGIKSMQDLITLHVPYKGTSGYTQDLLSGELMVGFLPVHIAQGFVNSGKLTALAVGSPKRHPVAPGVASFEELGVKGVEVDLWYAFFAPAKTPLSVVTRLNTEIASILKLPEVRDVLGRAGLDASASTPDELTAVAKKDYPRWGDVIRRNNITAD